MRATGVCGTDVHVVNGELPVPLPIIPGHEPVGEIDTIGPGVRSLKAGDRVGVSWFQAGCGRCRYCQKKQIKFCAEPKTWISNGGGYADYMIAEADGCTLLPDSLPWESAAPLFCGGFSAMSAYRAARPQFGDRIAVIGFGGLGHMALQIAKAMGHEVVVITNSPGKADDARKMGADEVLVVKDQVGKELQDIGAVDVILSFSPSMKQNSQGFAPMARGSLGPRELHNFTHSRDTLNRNHLVQSPSIIVLREPAHAGPETSTEAQQPKVSAPGIEYGWRPSATPTAGPETSATAGGRANRCR
jgi:D-arabinose 1-dehydrogenase-like Zn-dependent alcohol dehydrogenase